MPNGVPVSPQRCTRHNSTTGYNPSQNLRRTQRQVLHPRDFAAWTAGTWSSKSVTLECIPTPGIESAECRYVQDGKPVATTHKPPELPAGQQKLKSNNIVGEVSKRWNTMDQEMKVALTDPLMEDLIALRQEADTKPKIAPVHVLHDVSTTMAKINREVRP